MARSFLSFNFALATAALVLYGVGATPASAQPVGPSTSGSIGSSSTGVSTTKPDQSKYPEVQQAVNLLLGPTRDMAGALKLLKKAEKMYPELPVANVMLYQIFAQLNQAGQARFQLEIAVNTSPSDPEAYIILGNIAMQERRLGEATMDFEKAQQLLAVYSNAERKGALQQQTASGIAQLAEAREKVKDGKIPEYAPAAKTP